MIETITAIGAALFIAWVAIPGSTVLIIGLGLVIYRRFKK